MEKQIGKKVQVSSVYGVMGIMMNKPPKVHSFVSLGELVSLIRTKRMRPREDRLYIIPKYKGLLVNGSDAELLDFTYEVIDGNMTFVDLDKVAYIKKTNLKSLTNINQFVDDFIEKKDINRFVVYMLYTKNKDFLCYAVETDF